MNINYEMIIIMIKHIIMIIITIMTVSTLYIKKKKLIFENC